MSLDSATAATAKPTVMSRSRLRLYGLDEVGRLPQVSRLPKQDLESLRVVGQVFSFRTNNYVVEELIDWDDVPSDPIYRLNFPHREMLDEDEYLLLERTLNGTSDVPLVDVVARIRLAQNPHPDGQLSQNIPMLDGQSVPGVQHKYRETCLVFPSGGQTCHAYCTYCFRWPQFAPELGLRFATDHARTFSRYVEDHKEITDVLFTGGDPLIMSTSKLAAYVRPLLGVTFDHVQSIRLGTKALGFWPYRFTTDPDAGGLLDLFREIRRHGRHLTLMAHFNHIRELSTPAVRQAIELILESGAQIRCQSPVVRHVNDRTEDWISLWNEEVRLGCIPYYMFVPRETGTSRYFKLSLEESFEIFRSAFLSVSGLARTVRGPSMSVQEGKVVVEGIRNIDHRKVFVLSFIQNRRPALCKRPFFAVFDPAATWFDQLKPAFEEDAAFFASG